MTTKKEIIIGLVSHLRTAGEGYLDDPTQQVNQKNPEESQFDRSLIYRTDTRTETYNDGSKITPIRVKTNDKGEIIDEAYPAWKRLQANVQVNAKDKSVKEDMEQSIRSVFRPYFMWDDPDDFLPDVNEVSIDGASAADDASQEPVTRRDVLSITVFFKDVEWRYGSRGETGIPIRKTRQGFDPEGTEHDEPEPTIYETTEVADDTWYR